MATTNWTEPSKNSPTAEILGHTEPRLWTKPLRELTPETSYGFNVIKFANDILKQPLDPWQEWVAIHAGELLPDGRPRFRQVLLLVARQNGKTHLLKVLTLFWMFVEKHPQLLFTSTTLKRATEGFEEVEKTALANSALRKLVLRTKHQPGDTYMSTTQSSKLTTEAVNRKTGRGMTLHRLMMDELREHQTWDAYNAAIPATIAVRDAQTFMTSNAGDEKSEVLNSLQKSAEDGVDERLGIFGYIAPDGCDIEDPSAWAAANPNLGRRLDHSVLIGAAARAKKNGGDEEAFFRTEHLCQRVKKMNAAVNPAAWEAGVTDRTLAAYRSRVVLCLDVSLDSLHATLCAAAQIDEKVVHVEVVKAWDGMGCTQDLRAELPGWIHRVKPRALGWFPNGPAAALAADLGKVPRPGWPPAGVVIEELRGEMTAVCMGFAEQVLGGAVEHPDDELLSLHILSAEKLPRGDGWVFSRKFGQCDAAYAAAGAVHLARTLPAGLSTSVPMSSAVRAEVDRMRERRKSS